MISLATVTDIRLVSRENGNATWQIALDASPFVADTKTGTVKGTLIARSASGTALAVEILRVDADSDGLLWHTANKPLPVGTVVEIAARD